MSGGSGYNDWESDLSSIIEKTNQNLKMLRRIGDRRTDLGSGGSAYDVSTTSSRPGTSSAAQIASDMRNFASSISNRYAAEDAASSSRNRHASTTAIPRAASAGPSTAGSRKLHRSSSVEVDARARARESLIIRPPTTTNAFNATSDGEDESDERSPRVRHASGVSGGPRASSSGSTLKRSSSLAAKSKSSNTRTSAVAYGGGSSSNNVVAGAVAEGVALDELRKSLEVHIAARSSAFEKVVADLKTDMAVVTSETNSLAMKMQELRDGVNGKLTNAAATASSVVEHGESISRLEKHSAVLLGWKVGVDQDLFEISSKVKSVSSIQEKMNSLEGHLEALGTAIKAANRTARHDEKIEELKDRIAILERQTANQLDSKAVEHAVQMRVSKEINELENRFNQSLQFLTQKIESKLQSLEKTVQSDRIDAIASVKTDLLEDVDKLESRVAKKAELTPIQNAQMQMKDDIAHMQLFFERQDKRFQELKQNSAQIRDELVETRHELTKALHAQQSRVSTTLEEKVGQLTILTKDKNTKAEQKVAMLEKRFKKVEEQCKHLSDSVAKVEQDAFSRQAADTVTQQREAEKLRQRLVRTIADLDQLQTSKQELERTFEMQDRQYQAKLKELRAQIDEQERLKEALRTEMLQAVQNESRQIGVLQGRNSLLESLLSREKQDSEEKAQQIHKARQEITQIRQKMRTLENEVDKKMQKLSSEVQTKQMHIESLTKKLARSEDEAQKLNESSRREKKLLMKTKELKQQELALTKTRLRELEKVAANLSLTRSVETKATSQVDDLAAKMAEMEVKRNELQALVAERQAEAEELRSELYEMKSEREDLIKKHSNSMNIEIKRLNAEYGTKIEALEHEIASKDSALLELRESLEDKSELEELSDALTQTRQEKVALLEQLQAARLDHEHLLVETESSLRITHSAEMEKLQSQIEARVVEITASQHVIDDSRVRIASLEGELKLNADAHKEEVVRLASEMKEAKMEAERLGGEMEQLRTEKSNVEKELDTMRRELESISAGDEELLEEMENLRQQYDELGAERERLIDGLRAKAEEVTELNQLETQHRERIEQLLHDQREAQTRVEQETTSMRQTIEQERAAAAESERQLKRTIDVLQAEIETAMKQSADTAANASKLGDDLESIKRELESSVQSEQDLKQRLDRIKSELMTVGAVSSADDDPSRVLRSYIHVTVEKHSLELAALAARHDEALKEATIAHDRAHALEVQITELSAQLEDLEGSNKELKAELEKHCTEHAEQAQELGRLEDEIATVLDQKHSLEEHVAELTNQVEELDATLQNQTFEKNAEVNELRDTNAKLSKTVADIREAMEHLERDKQVELDSLNGEIQELELTLTALNERPRGNSTSMEKEFFANQQTVAAATQSIRNMYTKLTNGCSVVELQDLKAALIATEAKYTQARETYRREKHRLAEADEEVLLNVEFLDGLVQGWNKNDASFAAKYIHAAPTLATRLSRLQQLCQEALKQCFASLPTTETGHDEQFQSSPDQHESDAMATEDPDEEEEVDEDQEEFDEDEESAELSSSDALNESQTECSTELGVDAYDPLDGVSHSQSAMGKIPEAVDTVIDTRLTREIHGANEFRLTLDVVTARAEACTTLINSPTGAMLTSERFEARHSAVLHAELPAIPVRAESSTTLLRSPTATLLNRRFEPRTENVQFTLDESAREDPCTTIPHSPTALLLQDRFKPFQGSTRIHDDETHENEQVELNDDDGEIENSDNEASLVEHDSRNDAEGEHIEAYATSQAPNFSVTDEQQMRESMYEPELAALDSGSEDDADLEQKSNNEDDDDESGDGHEDSLSQSLEAMVRLAAGDESIGHGGTRVVDDVAENAHSSDEDELIDSDSDEDRIDASAADEGISSFDNGSQLLINEGRTVDALEAHDDESDSRSDDEHEQLHDEVSWHIEPSTSSLYHDEDTSRAVSSLYSNGHASHDDDTVLRTYISRPMIDSHARLKDEHNDFDDADDEVDLEESLEQSAVEEDASLHAEAYSVPPPAVALNEYLNKSLHDMDHTPSSPSYALDKEEREPRDDDGDRASVGDADGISDLEESQAAYEQPLEIQQADDGIDHHKDLDSDSEIEQSAEMDTHSPLCGAEDQSDDADADSLPASSENSPMRSLASDRLVPALSLPRPADLTGNGDGHSDDERSESLSVSTESSPTKPLESERLASSLPLSRLTTLRSDSDDDELSIDIQRRGLKEEDGDFDEENDHATRTLDIHGDRRETESSGEISTAKLNGDNILDEGDDDTPGIHTGESSKDERETLGLDSPHTDTHSSVFEADSNSITIDGHEPTDDTLERENDDDELISDHDLDESNEQVDKMGVGQESLAHTRSFSLQTHPERFEQDPEQLRLGEEADQEEEHHNDLHAEDSDSDFDEVLSASRDEDEEEGGFRDHERGLDEESMDEVEKLLLQHAEKPTLQSSELSPMGGNHLFSSGLRMDDEDELIDSESDENANHEPAESIDSQNEDHLADGRPDDSFDADDLDALTASRNELEDDHFSQPQSNPGNRSESGRRDDQSLIEGDKERRSMSDEENEEEIAQPSAHPTRISKASTTSFAPSRKALRNFDDSEEEDEDDGTVASSMSHLGSQLPPLSGLGSRARGAGGSGSLMKALQATRSTMASEFDDEEDEVEKLMLKQSFQHKPPVVTEGPAPMALSQLRNSQDDEVDEGDNDVEDPLASQNRQDDGVSQTAAVAFSLARKSFEEDSDDEVEKLMATQVSQRKPANVGTTSSSFLTSSFLGKFRADEFDDEDDDVESMESMNRQVNTVDHLVDSLTTRTFEEDSDDEVEKLMKTQVSQHKPVGTRSSAFLTSSLLEKSHDEEFDDEDDEIERLMTQHKTIERTEPAIGSLTRTTLSADFDDEAEKRMPSQRSQRIPEGSSSTLTGKSHDEGFDDENGNEERVLSKAVEDTSTNAVTLKIPAPHASQVEHDASDQDDDHRVGNARIHSTVQDEADTHISGEGQSLSQEDDEVDELDESLLEEEVVEEDESSLDDASGTFGMSFGDDILERALEASTQAAPLTQSNTGATTQTRHRRDSESDDDDDDATVQKLTMTPTFSSSAGVLGAGRKLGTLQPLPSLGKTPLPGLSASTRRTLTADDDDMDEVERLLEAQTIMRTTKPVAASASLSHDVSALSPLKDTNLPMADDEFAHFDRDDDDEASPARRTHAEISGSESELSAPPSPSRIPILPGSSLLQKNPTGSPIRPPVVSRRRQTSTQSEDDGAEAYLEDSFDLEESLQEDGDNV